MTPALQILAVLTTMWRPLPAPEEPKRPFVVLVDPGHGGSDTGACAPNLGVCEKDLTLAMAKGLAEILERRPDIRVRLTRDRDVYVPVYRRSLMANELHADLFVSLHLNASPDHTQTGFEVYSYGDLPGLSLGEGRGRPQGPILSDLMERGLRTCSSRFARAVGRQLRRVAGRSADRGAKRAAFGVLSALHMPGVLVEFGFLDHPAEGRRLTGQTYRRRLLEAVARAILEWRRVSAKLGCTRVPPATQNGAEEHFAPHMGRDQEDRSRKPLDRFLVCRS